MDFRATALLLLDLQQDVLPTVPEPERLLMDTQRCLAWARSLGLDVHFVRLSLTAADREEIPERNIMFHRFASTSFCSAGSSGTELPAAIAPLVGEQVHDKKRVGAFRTTGLHGALSARGINSLILGGIHTSGVVLSTLRDAADLDYGIIVPAELCRDPNEGLQQTLLTQLFPRQAEVISLERLIQTTPDRR